MCSRTPVIVVASLVLGVLAIPQRAAGQTTHRVYDTFTDSADRYLQNHQPDVSPNGGANWRWQNGGGRTIVTAGIAKNYGGTSREVWTYDSALPNAVVSVDLTSGSGTPGGGLIFRYVSANHYFMLDASGPTLYRNDNGYLQHLGSGGKSVRAGEQHRLEVHVDGAIIDVYFDLAFLFRVSDWTYADGVQHGFYYDAPNDPNASFDNFEIRYLVPLDPCNYSVSPSGRNISSDKFSGTIEVTAQPGCVWNAWSESDFINVVDTGGSGSGTVRYGVENSTSSESRTGILAVAGSTIRITQSARTPAPPPPSADSTPAGSGPNPPPPPASSSDWTTAAAGPVSIVWNSNVPDPGQVNSCWGNCGAACGNKPNPCGGPSDWSNQWLSVPQYVDDNFPISTCFDVVVVTNVYRHYAVTGRWTYHGRSSDGCRLHDNICRALGSGVAGFLGCFLAAVVPGSAYCSGARDENWSYTYVLDGRSVDPIATYVDSQPCGPGF
jgi:hypothetical protein